MRRLSLTPEARDFACKPRSGVAAVLLDSPAPAYHGMEPVQAWDVDATWFVGAYAYDYLMAFWRTETRRGVRRFLLALPLEGGEPVDCVCTFTRAPALTETRGQTATVKARLEAVPVDRTVFSGPSDDALVAELQAL